MYEVYLERSVENDLKRLPTSIFHRIIPQIKTLAANPRPFGCRKITGSKNDWRIRNGWPEGALQAPPCRRGKGAQYK